MSLIILPKKKVEQTRILTNNGLELQEFAHVIDEHLLNGWTKTQPLFEYCGDLIQVMNIITEQE